MLGFLVGWGVFWLLIWLAIWFIGAKDNDSELTGPGVIGAAISVFYLVAVLAGRMVSMLLA